MERIELLTDLHERDEIERITIINLNKLIVSIANYRDEPSEKNYKNMVDKIAEANINIEMIKVLNDIESYEIDKLVNERLNRDVFYKKQESFNEQLNEVSEAEGISDFEEVAPDLEVTKGRILIDLKTDEDVASALQILNNQLRKKNNE